jgi:tripartite-type tricarboxylate transporter receptor subunit TctC
MLPYVKSGEFKCLAILAPTGFPSVPGCKTPAEQGYNFRISVWNGIFAPKNTPPAIVAKLAKAIEASMQEPEMKEYAEKTGTILEFVGPDAAKAQIAEEEKGLRDIMTTLGMVKK